jgi:ribosome biogenesis GTPase
MTEQLGRISFGAKNIFKIVAEDGSLYECRIKGKVLHEQEPSYNPLAPGDLAAFQVTDEREHRGVILRRKERSNAFVRWNPKREAPQTIAANVDLLVCIASAGIPPFRPRFIDRVMVAGYGIPVIAVLNKVDAGLDDEMRNRMEDYRRIGYEILYTSGSTGEGTDGLRERVHGRRAAFIGQSGVGKSTLLNILYPGAELTTGGVSVKYRRGRHITKNACLYARPEGEFIDTPGIRQIEPAGIEASELDGYFPEFRELLERCEFQPCSHRHEPGCAVLRAVENGGIHADRYETYVRLYDELQRRYDNEYYRELR